MILQTILLDSDHFSVITSPIHNSHGILRNRMSAAKDAVFAAPIVVVEEAFRGWTAAVKKSTTFQTQVLGYLRFNNLLVALRNWNVAGFDPQTAEIADTLRKSKLRIGTMDLKIAAIAIQRDALLLTANKKDFGKVPGLRFENWLV